MKLDYLIQSSTLLALLSSTNAFPGAKGGSLAKTIEEIRKRAAAPISGPLDSNELIGDLATKGAQSTVGKVVADIIMGKADGQSLDAGYNTPGALDSDACKKDVCCKFKWAADEMAAAMRGASGRCNALARGVIRLGFHDAGAWKKGMDYGGADGSMVLTDEISRDDNRGLEEAVNALRGWYNKYKGSGATAADLVQLAANVGTVVCPLGPRVRTFVGRKDNPKLPPTGLLPGANDSADKLIALFGDKTIKANGLVSLLGAHTTSQQRFFNTAKAFDPQDSTPGTWDVLFYSQTSNSGTPPRVLKFPSDVNMAAYSPTQGLWKSFEDPKQGQQKWNDFYAKEYVRLSLLGVNNINDMQECTKVLPPAVTSFNPPDQDALTSWLSGGFANSGQAIGQLLENGGLLSNASLQQVGINPADWGNKNPGSGAGINIPRPATIPAAAPTQPPAAAATPPKAAPSPPQQQQPQQQSQQGGGGGSGDKPMQAGPVPEGFPNRPGIENGGIGKWQFWDKDKDKP